MVSHSPAVSRSKLAFRSSVLNVSFRIIEASKSAKIEVGIKPFSKHVGEASNKVDSEPSFKLGIESLARGEVAARKLMRFARHRAAS